MREGVSLVHVPRLAEVVTGRRDGLSFDVDVVVGADGEVGAPRPTDRGKRCKTVTAGWRRHLVERLTGQRTNYTEMYLVVECNYIYSYTVSKNTLVLFYLDITVSLIPKK